MSTPKKGMIRAVQAEPQDLTVRAICADALEEEGYTDENVLGYLRGGEVHEAQRQGVREELRTLFGGATAVRLEPPAWYPEQFQALVTVIQDQNATTEQRRNALADARSAVLNVPVAQWAALQEQFYLLSAIIAFQVKDPIDARVALEHVSDLGLQTQLVGVIVESKDPINARVALEHVTDQELREALQAVLVQV